MLWPLLLPVFLLGMAIAIVFSGNGARFGTRASYAVLAILAPIALLAVGSWLQVDRAPGWLFNGWVILTLVSPYLVRTLFVFRESRRDVND